MRKAALAMLFASAWLWAGGALLRAGSEAWQPPRVSTAPATAKKPAQRTSSRPAKAGKASLAERKRILRQNEEVIGEKTVYKYNRPEDLIELIPVVRDINRLIPRRFSLADHQFKLESANQLTIEHHFMDLETRQRAKNSIISLTYSGDWSSQYEANVDVPLFYSSLSGFSKFGWRRYPVGNYTMTLNRGLYSNEERLYIRAVTRF